MEWADALLYGVTNNKNFLEDARRYSEDNLNNIHKKALENPYNIGHLFIWFSNNLAAAVATYQVLGRLDGL
jgi:hypothetical protein